MLYGAIKEINPGEGKYFKKGKEIKKLPCLKYICDFAGWPPSEEKIASHPQKPGTQHDIDGIGLPYAHDDKAQYKQAAADIVNGRSGARWEENQHQNPQPRRRNEGDDRRAEPAQDSLHQGMVLELFIEIGQRQNDDAGWQNTAQRGDNGARKPGNFGSDKGGAVDADGPGGDFRDGDDVGELRHREPSMQFDNLRLNERERGVPAANAE